MALIDNLIVQLNMNDELLDSIGTNHGTAYGATFTTDAKLGSHAILEDGIDDSVLLANESNFDFERTSSFSVEGWFKMTATSWLNLVAKLVASGNYNGWVIDRNASNQIRFALINVVGSNILRVYTNSSFASTTAWYHIVITYAGTSAPSGIKIYVDNVDQALSTLNNTLSASILNNESVCLGRLNATTGDPYKGNMDSVRIWSRVLTVAEVAELWNSGTGIEITAGGVVGQIMHGKTLKSLTMGRLVI